MLYIFYRVVAMDMRGYGESDKPERRHAYVREKLVDDVRQLIQKLGKFSLQSNKKKESEYRFYTFFIHRQVGKSVFY